MRLRSQPGERIDRSHPIQFTYAGKELTGFDERRELPRRRARARSQPPRDLVRAERGLFGEDVEDRERPLGRGDTRRRRLTRLRHSRSVSLYRMQLRRTG